MRFLFLPEGGKSLLRASVPVHNVAGGILKRDRPVGVARGDDVTVAVKVTPLHDRALLDETTEVELAACSPYE